METIKFFNNRAARLSNRYYFLRGQDRLEIDLMMEIKGKLYPVEIKTSYKNAAGAAEVIDKMAAGYKSLPVDKGYVLSLSGKHAQISPLTSASGLDDYFTVLEKLI
jgi:hypothetical protein